MYLTQLHLKNFRNYSNQIVNFSEKKTIILGNNAQGKSNLLEAVALLSTLKSHRTSKDKDLILEGKEESKIEGILERKYGKSELGLILRNQGRKTLILNQENLRKQVEFLGVLNTVEFSSLDLDLVRGSPDFRRSWLDNLLIQIEPIYAYILSQYNHILRQRNALLKKIRTCLAERENDTIIKPYLDQLSLWNEQLAEYGSRITRRRARVLKRLAPFAKYWHGNISGKTEELNIIYNPHIPWTEDNPNCVKEAFLDKIEQRKIAEQYQGKTLVGIHRDEIELTINETPAKSYGSQGQQRTLVLALKLAELNLIEAVIGEPPLLLLDDVLAELDPHRQNFLLETIQSNFQTLITTTHLNSFDAHWLKESQILSVKKGTITDF
jgi:DNA replication and repair protein RecF